MINTYQLAGLDHQERGFTRQVEITCREGNYQARFRFETLKIEGNSGGTEEWALQELVQALSRRGFTQLRTQLIFRGEHYLGNQEVWVEYPDPAPPPPGVFGWIRKIVKRRQSG